MHQDLLKRIIADQKADDSLPIDYFERTAAKQLAELASNKEIIVITGMRRSGKSVLMQNLRCHNVERDYYFNFEDERLVNFAVEHFQILLEVFVELYGQQKTFYFDEIQNISGWEKFVRRLYNSGNKIYITGSNANLFSVDLGTRLTGRYIALKVYPFSFYEFVQHHQPRFVQNNILSTQQIGLIKQLLNQYYTTGGIPEYVKVGQVAYLHAVYESIIYRDIIVKYKISSEKNIKELLFYLASNCSKEMTYNSVRKLLQLGSTTTISDYCTYLQNSFLCFFVNRYHLSVKVQILSPKKVYFIDHVLAKIMGFHFSDDKGRMLENIVFMELKRRNFDIFYHKETKECDFIIRANAKIVDAIQVCVDLHNEQTAKREIDGLIEAMAAYNLSHGIIITEHEAAQQKIVKDDVEYNIEVVPLWRWLLGT